MLNLLIEKSLIDKTPFNRKYYEDIQMRNNGILDLRLRSKNLFFSIAKTEECIEEVHRLINKVYRNVGYILEDEKDMFPDKYSKYSTVFYAMNKETRQIEAGLRSVDDIIGLPLEEVFDISSEKEKIKSRGGKYVECGMRVTYPRPNPNASFGAIALLYKYLVKENITDAFIAMQESDKMFYQRLGFKVMGETKVFEKVHRVAYFMHAVTKEWREPYKSAFLQECDNIILNL